MPAQSGGCMACKASDVAHQRAKNRAKRLKFYLENGQKARACFALSAAKAVTSRSAYCGDNDWCAVGRVKMRSPVSAPHFALVTLDQAVDSAGRDCMAEWSARPWGNEAWPRCHQQQRSMSCRLPVAGGGQRRVARGRGPEGIKAVVPHLDKALG